MEGLEVSVIASRLLNDEFRFDAQFFRKRFLDDDDALARHDVVELGTFANVTDGPHGYHEVDEDSPIAMLTARSAAEWFADRLSADTIAEWVDKANRRSSLESGDLILASRGSVGNCALIIPECLPANIDQDVGRISLKKDACVNSEYLNAYLNSAFGQDHIQRHASGMVQQGISLSKIRAIPVPIFSIAFQDSVRDHTRKALELRRRSISSTEQAEDALLVAMGLAGWSPPEPLSYTASAADAVNAARLDAQYFRPKYDEAIALLRGRGNASELKDLVSLNSRGRQPVYADEGLPIINSKHVRINSVKLTNDNRFGEVGHSPVVIRQGDVLLNGTGVGTIGRAAPYLFEKHALPDNHVTVIRPIQIDPIYLAVFLNSTLGQLQIDRLIKGSSGQIELYPDDIAKILIWNAPRTVQAEVREALLYARDLEIKSRALLSAAKRAVEIAIEKNDAAALAYLERCAMYRCSLARCPVLTRKPKYTPPTA